MELGGGYKPRKGSKMKKHLHGGTIALNPDTLIVIKIPDAQVLRILSRSLFLAMVLVMFFGTILRGISSSSHSFVSEIETTASECANVEVELSYLIFPDLADEGLLKLDDKALIVNPPNGFGGVAPIANDDIDVVLDSDSVTKSLFPDESYDFVFASCSIDAEFVDRVLKIGGIVALPLGANPSNAAFRELSHYRVVYLRQYGSTSVIVALRKTGPAIKLAVSSSKRKLFQLVSSAKTAALKGLEDALLEPPRQAFVESKEYLKKINYLPDLLGDSLEGYNRRLFIGVGLPEENKGVIEWFESNYPKKNTKFEIHSLHVASEDRVLPHTDVSLWLSKHVKEEEYVVMKAEADVVEEMIEKRTICLVDELFLECSNVWWQTGKRKKSVRAYWECLALYGRLRDEGVAVHQWWG